MTTWVRRLALLVISLGLVGAAQTPAAAHEERDVDMPYGTGSVPMYRTTGPEILVCKTDRGGFQRRIAGFPAALRAENLALFERCLTDGFRDVQAAVGAASNGARIRILPGEYREQPSLPEPSGACANLEADDSDLGYQVLDFDQQVACPHNQNLIAILDKENLQIEGTGAGPEDVIIDASYEKLNALRADRADGIYLRNFTAQSTTFNAIYVIETDGFVIDQVIGRWNDEYGFLTFATDHGLYTDCEAYGNGDSGIYPGAASDINADRGLEVDRYAIEIRNCSSHHNLLGFSGTAGNSVWAHDNEFYENTAGVSMDSAFPDHPGLPQNHSKFERNDIHDNNVDYYDHVRDGTCAKPSAERGYENGVVCPSVGVPLGAGILTAGGNFNIFQDNWIYGHDYAGSILFWVPAVIRGESLGKLVDTSHHNRYSGNHFGVSPTGQERSNDLDVWWDGQGRDNRWQSARAEPVTLPGLGGLSTHRIAGDPLKTLKLADCGGFSLIDARVPAGCDWYGASNFDRIDVRAAAIQAALFILAALMLLWRRLPRGVLAHAATAAGVLGAIAEVLGIANEGTRIGALASALLAAWWLIAGWLMLRDGAFRGLAWTTLALGGLAALQVIDRGIYMLPFVPISFGWPILLIGLVWVVWVLADPSRRPRLVEGPLEPDPAGPATPSEPSQNTRIA